MNKAVEILYKNYKGVIAKRTIEPIRLWFGKTEYHPTEQWLLRAYDIKKGAQRDFAMKDITEWRSPGVTRHIA